MIFEGTKNQFFFGLELTRAGKSKRKIAGVLKFLADKGADALIAMLPYLGQMAGMIK